MKSPSRSPDLPLYLGCPVWNCDAWSDRVFPAGTGKQHWLSWYTRMFNTVEGNSFFYGLPDRKHVQRWADEAADGFQFCMKFPRTVSHDMQLVGTQAEMSEFLTLLQILQSKEHLGPSFLQLGPEFSPRQFAALETFLRNLPSDMPWAVEVRHHDWFDLGTNENRLNDLLRDLKIDKVIFDSRALFQSPPSDEIERVSQSRKPKSPVRQTVTHSRPMLRFVGRNTIPLVDKYIDQWVPIVAGWIERGLQPFIFTHAPNDAFAPEFARRFWDALRVKLNEERASHGALPIPPRPAKQLDLFG